ncbi:RNA recognition motif domain-containing protein [Ditylenchus destructor]|nr:RNA recognition motif domain-containing protein [Ditylenchus destructor]
MSTLRNILQRRVRNASILGRTPLRLQPPSNFCPIYSDPFCISRKAYLNTVKESPFAKVNRAMNDRPHLIGGKPLQIGFIGQGEDKVSLFIGSLPENVTGETLREEFSKYGKPIFWKVENDGRFNQSGAYGIVSYGSEEEALKALNSGPHTIEGVVVDVRKSNEGNQSSKEKSDD